MPISLASGSFPLTEAQVQALWEATFKLCKKPDDTVSVKAVALAEMRTLNRDHRGKDKPTNVLTFSYDAWKPMAQELLAGREHDVAVCLEVAQAEAAERGVTYTEYVALLLTHAFLHACGFDHELSADEAAKTVKLEEDILRACGYQARHLS